MKLFSLRQIFTLLILVLYSHQACDPDTCKYCCVLVDGESTCDNNLLECRLTNKRHYSDVLVLISIVLFWCVGIPFLLYIAKQILVHPICCGHTLFSVIEGLFICCSREERKRQIMKRPKVTGKENIQTLKKIF